MQDLVHRLDSELTVLSPVSAAVQDLELCWIEHRHVRPILEIERQCFRWPIRRGDLVEILRVGHCLVAELWGRVVGYVLFQVDDRDVFLHSLAVDHPFRGHGIGTCLLAALKQFCRDKNLQTIGAEIRESNLDAQQFLSRRGFIADWVIRSPYTQEPYRSRGGNGQPACTEDAYSFVWRTSWE